MNHESMAYRSLGLSLGSQAFIVLLLFNPSMSALPIFAKQALGCSPTNREWDLGDRLVFPY